MCVPGRTNDMAEKKDRTEHFRHLVEAQCRKTGVRIEGVEKLVEFYMGTNGWTEEAAYTYAYHLFRNGTLQTVRDLAL
jgi:hypothetical protein